MRAFIVSPGKPQSGRLDDVPEPTRSPDQALVQVLSVGVDGTDRELIEGRYGEAPPGDDYLIIGHESLGRVAALNGSWRASQNPVDCSFVPAAARLCPDFRRIFARCGDSTDMLRSSIKGPDGLLQTADSLPRAESDLTCRAKVPLHRLETP